MVSFGWFELRRLPYEAELMPSHVEVWCRQEDNGVYSKGNSDLKGCKDIVHGIDKFLDGFLRFVTHIGDAEG